MIYYVLILIAGSLALFFKKVKKIYFFYFFLITSSFFLFNFLLTGYLDKKDAISNELRKSYYGAIKDVCSNEIESFDLFYVPMVNIEGETKKVVPELLIKDPSYIGMKISISKNIDKQQMAKICSVLQKTHISKENRERMKDVRWGIIAYNKGKQEKMVMYGDGRNIGLFNGVPIKYSSRVDRLLFGNFLKTEKGNKTLLLWDYFLTFL